MSKLKHFSVRIDDEALNKLHYVAKYEDRSASGQVMYLIHKCIRDFEKEHGKIDLADGGF